MAFHYDGHGFAGPGPDASRRRAGGGPNGSNGHAPGVDAPEPRGLRERVRATLAATRATLGGFPRVLALVWGASKPLTLTLAAATVLAGLVPAAQAYTAKLLINAIVRAITLHLHHAPDHMVLVIPLLWGSWRLPTLTVIGVVIVLAAIQFLIAAFSSLLQTLTNISQQLLQERVSMRVQLLIMERASTLDLTFFEDSQSYDTLQLAQREATSRPVMMVSGTFGLVRTALTFLTMIALLLGVNRWLAVIALLAPIPSFISDARYGWRGYAIARRNSPARRAMAYFLTLLTTDTFAKEV